MTDDMFIVNKVAKYLQDESSDMMQSVQKLIHSGMHDDEVNDVRYARKSSAEPTSEFTLEDKQLHSDYVELVEERLECFLRSEGFSNATFALALRTALRGGASHGKDAAAGSATSMIDYVMAMVDFDIFMTMVDDVRNGTFSAE
jgi:hypothetical protein